MEKNKNIPFSTAELVRYGRHITLPEFGIEGQQKLKKSSVLVVGAGGLSCPMLLYLASAGVGTIGIVDDDVVELSNLQRQVLFTIDDIDNPKVKCAADRLSRINPEIEIIPIQKRLNSTNALEIIANYDVVTDGSDNFPTRYLVNDACVMLHKTIVHGSIFRFEGQVSVFNQSLADGSRSPNYRDLFPSPPPVGLVPDCAEGGVLGVLPGIIGSIQANEVIKVLSGIGETLAGRLFILDALSFETRIMKIRKNPNLKPITTLLDYELFCNTQKGSKIPASPAISLDITVKELEKLLKDASGNYQLIDVREPYEYEHGNIGGISIPLGTLENNINKIHKNVQLICICRSGKRSQEAIVKLKQMGFENVSNLQGGLREWVSLIDPTFPLA